MGASCYGENKKRNEIAEKNEIKKTENIERDTDTDIIKNNKRKNESKTKIAAIDVSILNEISKSICKINVGDAEGTGFLIEILKKKYLMTCEHVITKDLIDKNENIEITFNKTIKKNIRLDVTKRFIRALRNNGKDIDATIIEILEEDNIDQNSFLEPDLKNINNSNKLLHKKIWIYEIKTQKLSQGEIIKIENNEFVHNATTESGFSGSPVLLENNKKVIGIHKQGSRINEENYGDFLGPVYDFLIENNIEDENIKKINQLEEEIEKNENQELIENNGDYYIGQIINEAKNGKGREYYKNGECKYIGNFVNGKYEGLGKYIYKNGIYYLGFWKKGLKNGKGKVYFRDNTFFYGGYFGKDKYLGNNKIIEKIN